MKKRARKKLRVYLLLITETLAEFQKINETIEWRYKVELSRAFEDKKMFRLGKHRNGKILNYLRAPDTLMEK